MLCCVYTLGVLKVNVTACHALIPLLICTVRFIFTSPPPPCHDVVIYFFLFSADSMCIIAHCVRLHLPVRDSRLVKQNKSQQWVANNGAIVGDQVNFCEAVAQWGRFELSTFLYSITNTAKLDFYLKICEIRYLYYFMMPPRSACILFFTRKVVKWSVTGGLADFAEAD